MSASVIMPVVLVVTIPVFTTVFTNVGNDSFGHFHGSVFYDLQLRHFLSFTGGKADGGYDTGVKYD